MDNLQEEYVITQAAVVAAQSWVEVMEVVVLAVVLLEDLVQMLIHPFLTMLEQRLLVAVVVAVALTVMVLLAEALVVQES
jgi:hypothetical protein